MKTSTGLGTHLHTFKLSQRAQYLTALRRYRRRPGWRVTELFIDNGYAFETREPRIKT